MDKIFNLWTDGYWRGSLKEFQEEMIHYTYKIPENQKSGLSLCIETYFDSSTAQN
jgi:hypothetical protein